MTVQQQAVTHFIGSDRILTFGPIIDTLTGGYISLSGAHAIWRLAKLPTSRGADILITLRDQGPNPPITFTNITLYGQVQWSVSVALAPADTLGLPPSLPPNTWYHELQISDSNGKLSVAASGPFTLNPSITSQP